MNEKIQYNFIELGTKIDATKQVHCNKLYCAPYTVHVYVRDISEQKITNVKVQIKGKHALGNILIR